MPVITSSQSKIVNSVVVSKPATSTDQEITIGFHCYMNKLMDLVESVQGKENKMRIWLKIYESLNESLPKLVETSVVKWLGYAATVFNKTNEFISQAKTGSWAKIDKYLARRLYIKMYEIRHFIERLIKNNWDVCSTHKQVIKAKEEITRMENSKTSSNHSSC